MKITESIYWDCNDSCILWIIYLLSCHPHHTNNIIDRFIRISELNQFIKNIQCGIWYASIFLVTMAAKKKTPPKKTSTSKSAEFKRRSAVKKVKILKKTAYSTITNKGAKRKTTTKKIVVDSYFLLIIYRIKKEEKRIWNLCKCSFNHIFVWFFRSSTYLLANYFTFVKED